MHRRKFIQTVSLASFGISAVPQNQIFGKSMLERKFKIALNPGIIGVKANLAQTLDYSIQFGYESISPFTQEIMDSYSDAQLNELLQKMKLHGISFESTNLPVEFRRDNSKFNTDFKGLRKFCQIMEKQGASRINTWIISSHPELTYTENMKRHAYRLGECAKVMKDYGIRLGLEYLGTRIMLNENRYPFISSMKEGKELIGNIGESNVGFVLDSFHWYCADENIDDIRTLKPEEVVVVDINDAQAGLSRQMQIDGKRELPMATGQVPIKDFLQGLLDIGYDGPVRTEPFNQALNALENEEALKVNMEAIRKALKTVAL